MRTIYQTHRNRSLRIDSERPGNVQDGEDRGREQDPVTGTQSGTGCARGSPYRENALESILVRAIGGSEGDAGQGNPRIDKGEERDAGEGERKIAEGRGISM